MAVRSLRFAIGLAKLSPQLHQELSVAAAHSGRIGYATHSIAKMAARISPIFFDTPSPEQCNGDLLTGCYRRLAVQSLEHETQTLRAESKRLPGGRYP
ncbi:hypothetical protein MPLDJ20_130048 [Mesorhizobium plurifarium]|uniref:Uncharacterized protein n=1 Tax=Mesorhizobium plurifarium TaxID=69974 RepID=A0A090EIU5_MESPL|nr:hypothetical protein MPLDJ20_130048 [Mesorhizobium plurifarium]